MLEAGIGKISLFTPVGNDLEALYRSYAAGRSPFSRHPESNEWILPVPRTDDELIGRVTHHAGLKADYLDRVALLALNCALENDVVDSQTDLIVIGSSRGATSLTEKSIASWLQGDKMPLYTSPGTTLGATASMLAQLHLRGGMSLEHSMTCSTGLQALLNGLAWLRGGLARAVLAGASEAPLTPYTLSQMRSLKIYAAAKAVQDYLQMPFDARSQGIVLSEGSILLQLKQWQPGMIRIAGWGFDTEQQKNPVAANDHNEALVNSMQQAVKMTGGDIDVVIAHATGTSKGDQTELSAIRRVFGNDIKVTSTKWLTGHSFGLAGLHSVALAILMLQHQEFIGLPYQQQPHIKPAQIDRVLVNALGFGGQVISVVLSR